jgi:hypothetical protein
MVKWSRASVIGITEASWTYQQVNPVGYGGEKDKLTTDQFNLYRYGRQSYQHTRLTFTEGWKVSLLQNDSTLVDLEDEPTIERFNLY